MPESSASRTGKPDRRPPIVRAYDLGLRNAAGAPVSQDVEIGDGVGFALVSGFEDRLLPASTDRSYTMARIHISPQGRQDAIDLGVTYWLSPPSGLDLPGVFINFEGKAMVTDPSRLRERDMFEGSPARTEERLIKAQRLLDAYEHIKSQGIRVPPPGRRGLETDLSLSIDEAADVEASVERIRGQFPQSAELVITSQALNRAKQQRLLAIKQEKIRRMQQAAEDAGRAREAAQEILEKGRQGTNGHTDHKGPNLN